MTPQDIAEYRLKWMPGHSVSVHSDKEQVCKGWCRASLCAHEWTISRNTDVYEHTFRFEHEAHARAFHEVFIGE